MCPHDKRKPSLIIDCAIRVLQGQTAAVEAGHLPGRDLHPQVVDLQALADREEVLDGVHLGRAALEARPLGLELEELLLPLLDLLGAQRRHEPEPGQVAFFPVIIMAMLAEGIAKTVERDSVVMALWRAVWTILLALLVLLLVLWLDPPSMLVLLFTGPLLLMLLVVDAIALAALVLLQQGRGADVGAAFGSGSSNTMFGSGGSASFLTKLTVWLAIGFFAISFGLAWTAKERAENMSTLGIPQVEAPAPDAAPADDVPAVDVPAVDVPEEAAEQLTEEAESVDSDIPDV